MCVTTRGPLRGDAHCSRRSWGPGVVIWLVVTFGRESCGVCESEAPHLLYSELEHAFMRRRFRKRDRPREGENAEAVGVARVARARVRGVRSGRGGAVGIISRGDFSRFDPRPGRPQSTRGSRTLVRPWSEDLFAKRSSLTGKRPGLAALVGREGRWVTLAGLVPIWAL